MMDKLYVISLITSTYFVYGLAVGYGDMDFYSDGFIMENLQHLAQKRLVSSQASGLPQLLRRLQKNSAFDAPTSNVQMRNSAVSGTGDITLEASFPGRADFYWFLTNTNFKPIVTKGDEGVDGAVKNSSLVVNVNQNERLWVALLVMADSSMACFRFMLNNSTQAAVHNMLFPNPAINIPNTATVSANREITLDVTLPRSAPNASKPAAFILYTYTDRNTEAIKTKLLKNTLLEPIDGRNFTMHNVPDAIEGFLTVYIRHEPVSNPDETPGEGIYMKFVDVLSTDVLSTDVSYRNDIVTFTTEPYVITTVPVNGIIRYGSVTCVAQGHPKPVITFSKNSRDISQNNVSGTKFTSGAYVSLDGKSSTEAAGKYVCKATSGNETITRDITMN